MKLPIEQWQFLKYSDERIGLECFKEHLIKNISSFREEKDTHITTAFKAGISLYVRQIIINEYDWRIECLTYLLDKTISDLKQLSK